MADEAVRVEMEHVRRRRWRISPPDDPYWFTVKAWTEKGALRKYRRIVKQQDRRQASRKVVEL
jgi:hypothetical protein